MQRPVPQPTTGEVLIRVAAAGVNRPDVMQRMGRYPPPPGASDIPGLEIAGTVVGLGAEAARYAIGAEVCALLPGGGYAEYATAAESLTLPRPAGLTMAEAASIPEALFTVWSNLVDRGHLSQGETVLIHGGSSGVGMMAIQVAKMLGARVLVTCGSAEKVAACRAIGADAAIDYKTEDFVTAVRTLTQGKGANLILDIVGGGYVRRNYEAAAVEGRILQVAAQDGILAEIDLRPLMQKRLVHTGSTLRPRPVEFKAAIAVALQANIWPALVDGRIRPTIDSTFPLAQASEAHRRIEAAEHIGKIVLTTNGSAIQKP